MADMANNTTSFFAHHEVSNEFRKIIITAVKSAIVVMNKVFKSLHINPALESYQIWQNANNVFRKEYKLILMQISNVIKKHTAKQIVDLFQGVILIIKHVERLVDHINNITENFMFIKQSNFFLDKQKP
jgi:phosphate transport system protein